MILSVDVWPNVRNIYVVNISAGKETSCHREAQDKDSPRRC
jgi:hypothetical protein